jgi:hypothetical protein
MDLRGCVALCVSASFSADFPSVCLSVWLAQGRELPSGTLPQTLLQGLAAVMVAWEPPQRARAHALFSALLPAASGGLRDPQSFCLLSALWHEARRLHTPHEPAPKGLGLRV